jgi:hypothetical protein
MNKAFLLLFLIFVSLVGFMVKLPRAFRGIGFELHALFHFCASILLLLLFPKRHFFILIGLVFFGIMIEVFQHVSNFILDRRIHGNFDPLDIKYNVLGILLVFLPFYGFKAWKTVLN